METAFNAEYVISLVAALVVAMLISRARPKLSPAITFVLIPLAVAYGTLQLLHLLMPSINRSGARISAYVENKTLGEINNMGYIQVFPPLMVVILVTVVLLFSGKITP